MDNEELVEYIDEAFYDMDIDGQIQYLLANPDIKIDPDDVESNYFGELSQEILEKGEKELSIIVLKKYYEATLELQREMYRRVRPSFDAMYRYGVHLLNNTLTDFADMDMEIKKLFVSFCILCEYVEPDNFDEFLDEYPQLTTFYENLEEIAYADDDAMCPILLRSVGIAYQMGTKHFKKNPQKAFRYFEKGAGLDYDGRQISWPFEKVADCAFEVAACYMQGLGVEKDLEQALSYFESAAGPKGVPAMAEIYLDKDFPWENYFEDRADLIFAAYDAYETRYDDYFTPEPEALQERIIAEIKELAASGNPRAKYRLAKAYELGTFVEKDLELALAYHSEVMHEDCYPRSAFFYYAHHTPRQREPYQLPDEINVGDTFYLGELLDEPLSWKVVQIHEDGPVLISEKILAVLPYNDDYADYESSHIRDWLNNQFFPKAFTEEEKAYILNEEYYAQSFSRGRYQGNVLLQDHLLLPNSTDIENWYGEGKEQWCAVHTAFSRHTGDAQECWLSDADSAECPKHVNFNNTNTRCRFHAGCKLGIRPIMLLKPR